MRCYTFSGFPNCLTEMGHCFHSPYRFSFFPQLLSFRFIKLPLYTAVAFLSALCLFPLALWGMLAYSMYCRTPCIQLLAYRCDVININNAAHESKLQFMAHNCIKVKQEIISYIFFCSITMVQCRTGVALTTKKVTRASTSANHGVN